MVRVVLAFQTQCPASASTLWRRRAWSYGTSRGPKEFTQTQTRRLLEPLNVSGQNMNNYHNSEKSVDVQASQWCCPHSRDATATTLSAETCPRAVIFILSTVLSQHFPFSEEQESKNSDALNLAFLNLKITL